MDLELARCDSAQRCIFSLSFFSDNIYFWRTLFSDVILTILNIGKPYEFSHLTILILLLTPSLFELICISPRDATLT